MHAERAFWEQGNGGERLGQAGRGRDVGGRESRAGWERREGRLVHNWRWGEGKRRLGWGGECERQGGRPAWHGGESEVDAVRERL